MTLTVPATAGCAMPRRANGAFREVRFEARLWCFERRERGFRCPVGTAQRSCTLGSLAETCIRQQP